MSGARDEVLVAAFAVALRRARKAAGLTPEQVALKANIDRTFAAFLETSKRQSSLSVICALAYAIGQTPCALISDTCEIAAGGPVRALSVCRHASAPVQIIGLDAPIS